MDTPIAANSLALGRLLTRHARYRPSHTAVVIGNECLTYLQFNDFVEAVLAAETPCAIWLAAPRHRDRAGARSRCRATLCPAPPDRLPRVPWRSSSATMQTAGIGAPTAPVGDAIDPVTVYFLRAQIKAEPLAHHPSEEAADRMLLPMGRAHDGSNRGSLRSGQHCEHASLFRARPAVAPRAGVGLRLARTLLLTR